MNKRIRIAIAALLVACSLAFGAHSFRAGQIAGGGVKPRMHRTNAIDSKA